MHASSLPSISLGRVRCSLGPIVESAGCGNATSPFGGTTGLPTLLSILPQATLTELSTLGPLLLGAGFSPSTVVVGELRAPPPASASVVSAPAARAALACAWPTRDECYTGSGCEFALTEPSLLFTWFFVGPILLFVLFFQPPSGCEVVLSCRRRHS